MAMIRRLFLLLLLPTAAAFLSPGTTQRGPVRTEPLHAWGPNAKAAVDATTEATAKATEALASTELDAKDAQQVLSSLTDTLDSIVQQSTEKMQTLLNQINEAFVTLLSTLTNGSKDATGPLINVNLDPIFAQMKETAASIGISNEDIGKVISAISSVTGALNTPETIAATAVISYVIINSILTWGDSPPPGRPYPNGKYDPVSARIYFDRRPLQVLARSLTIASKSLTFALSLAGDKLKGDETWNKNQQQRGLELAQLLTELGPTFIKSTLCHDQDSIQLHCTGIIGSSLSNFLTLYLLKSNCTN